MGAVCKHNAAYNEDPGIILRALQPRQNQRCLDLAARLTQLKLAPGYVKGANNLQQSLTNRGRKGKGKWLPGYRSKAGGAERVSILAAHLTRRDARGQLGNGPTHWTTK